MLGYRAAAVNKRLRVRTLALGCGRLWELMQLRHGVLSGRRPGRGGPCGGRACGPHPARAAQAGNRFASNVSACRVAPSPNHQALG